MTYDPLNPEEGQQVDKYKQYLEDLCDVVRTPEGSRVVCRLLENLGAFDPVWSSKNPNLAKNAVLSDFGKDILDDLAEADIDIHNNIQRTMRIRKKRGLE